MHEIEIRPSRYGAPVAQKLIALLMVDLTQRYGDPDGTPVMPVEFDPPDGGFFVAYADGEPVGCGAWRSWVRSDGVASGGVGSDGVASGGVASGGVGSDGVASGGVAEVKRVFVAAAGRRLGLARRIMATIEQDAKAHGRKRIILETGMGQPEAIALYEALGYERIEPFGHYKNEPGVRCFGKDL